MQFIQLGKNLANFLLLLLLTFFLIVFSVLFTIPIILLLIYRKIISKYALHCRKDLSKILTSGAHIFAVDDVTNKPCVNVVVICTFKGNIPIETLQSIVQEKIISWRTSPEDENPNSLLYPELQQYYHEWMGFLFWKWDTNFKLENHIRYYDYNDPDYNEGEKISFATLSRIKSNLLKRGWPESRSPWELLVIPDYQDNECANTDFEINNRNQNKDVDNNCILVQETQLNQFNIKNALRSNFNGGIATIHSDEAKNDKDSKSNEGGESGEKSTVLIFRFHHGLGDGMGFFTLLWNRLTEEGPCEKSQDDQLTKLKKALSQRRSLLYYLSLPFRIHYEYAKQLAQSSDTNEWKVDEKDLSGVVKSSVTKKIAMESIREIRRTSKASFSGIIMSLISGALAKAMVSSKLNVVPNTIHALLPIPSRYEDRGKLRNHITYIYPTLSLRNCDLRSRLMDCESHLRYLKQSTVPLVNGLVHRLAGSFPVPVIKSLHKNVFATVLISNFPGPMQQTSMFGHPLADVMFGTSCHGNNGICISVLSYDSDFRISIEVDEAVPSEHDNLAQVIATNIECELNDFLNYCDTMEISLV